MDILLRTFKKLLENELIYLKTVQKLIKNEK